MRFWDSSALVPLLAREAMTDAMHAQYTADPDTLVWWGTEVECASALARRERLGAAADEVAEAFARLTALAESWSIVDPTESVRATARRLVRTHDVRAADALQLAAALVASEGRPETLELVTLDARLGGAGRREGLQVIDA